MDYEFYVNWKDMINEEVYSHIPGLKKVKTVSSVPEEGQGLSDLAKRTWGVISKEDVIKSLCYDLKQLLEDHDVTEMVKGIFSVESNLSLVLESYEGNDVSLDRFFRNLSPILLQALYQNTAHLVDTELVIHEWMEALRIAVEDEFYFWQELLLEV